MRILLGRVKGDKGDTGSQGPRGPRGERGPQGPPGEPGQTDIYTRAESDARYQRKGESIDFQELARRIPTWQWKVTLPKSDHQTVTATVGGKTYTSDFYAPQGSVVTFSAKADPGYIAGLVSPRSVTLTSDVTTVTVTAAAESEEFEAGTKTFAVDRNYPPKKADSFIVPAKVYVLKWTFGEKELYSKVVPGNRFEATMSGVGGMYTIYDSKGIDINALGRAAGSPLTASWSKEINEHAVDVDWSK